MANKKITIYYYYPIKIENEKTKILDLSKILEGLSEMKPEERVIIKKEENIQLKKIEYKDNKWRLSFLRNIIDSPFKTKLDDEVDTAESLDEDEYVGQECCAIYDEKSKVIAIQNNRNSISYNGIANFLRNYTEDNILLSPITYQDKYCKISDDETIKYKSVIIGYTDVSLLNEIATKENNESIIGLTKMANDLSALNGKIELSVGKKKTFLEKIQLRGIVDFFKKHNDITKTLKVKMIDDDTIRIIDLINNKVFDSANISITKDDPKTFDKILDVIDSYLKSALAETFNKCNIYVNPE